jgi:soluble lytic murein transglycosylase-like protein
MRRQPRRHATASAFFRARAGLALCAVLLLAASLLAPRDTAAAETYRYKDPFGVWRTMQVPKGMGKHYRQAQIRVCLRVLGGAKCSSLQAAYANAGAAAGESDENRLARLQEHQGLEDYRQLIARAAAATGLDGALLGAVIAVESGFRKDARSPKGALGLMQLMPGTAAMLMDDTDLHAALVDPVTNVQAGSRHLRRLVDLYPGRLDLALAAYNAGEGAVQKYDGIPPYAETRAYVRDVIALYERLKLARAAQANPGARRADAH